MVFSSLSVTNCSTLFALAPGKYVTTVAVLMIKPGSFALGKSKNDITP